MENMKFNKDIYYFAYGSNMDEKHLNEWCSKKRLNKPEMEYIGVACLKQYKLEFNFYSPSRNSGAANIVVDDKSCVYGLLFKITKKNRDEVLRSKEGHPNVYNEIAVAVSVKQQPFDENVITYKVVQSQEKITHQPPTKEYKNLILDNARKYDFPEDYISYIEKIVCKD